MGILTHMMALELDPPGSASAQYRSAIEDHIRAAVGVTHVCFSRQYSDVVVIEYDPFLTTAQDIFNCVSTRHGGIRREVVLRQVAHDRE